MSEGQGRQRRQGGQGRQGARGAGQSQQRGSGRSRQEAAGTPRQGANGRPRQGGAGRPKKQGQRGSHISGPRELACPRTAREVALSVLRDVAERDAYANLALPAKLRDARLSGKEAALATELAAGTLRLRGFYDAVIALAAGRYIAEIAPVTLDILRLGAHQLLGMRTAAHAAVHECVELQKRVVAERGAGFVNGVLREIARADVDEWRSRVGAAASSRGGEVAELAAVHSHPEWVVRALRDALRTDGLEGELPELLAADNASPRVSLALLPTSGVSCEEAEALGINTDTGEEQLAATGPSPLGLELAGGAPEKVIRGLSLPAGSVRVQDQGSQLAALALASATPVRPGERWLDLCAGPGGKATLLAALALSHGASFAANEVTPTRASLVRSSLEEFAAGAAEAGFGVVAGGAADVGAPAAGAPLPLVRTADGRSPEAFGGEGELYDRILVDAPCSGLGALRRRPEARWRKAPGDIPELTRLQGELLAAAASHLSHGGVLAYVTCSPHLAETHLVAREFLARQEGFRAIPAPAVVTQVARPGFELGTGGRDGLFAQLWPHRHGTDAMFIALFTRS